MKQNKFKIFIISNMYPDIKAPYSGIFVKSFAEIIQEFFNIELIIIKGKKRSLTKKILSYVLFYWKIVTKLCFSKEMIYVHYANHSIVPFILFRQSILNNTIVNFHGSDLFPENKIQKNISKITSHLIKKVKGVVVPSEYFKEEVIKRYNIKKEKIFVSPSAGVDCTLFSPIENRVKNKEKIIGYAGRLDQGKGFEILLKAFVQLIKEENNFYLHVVGDGKYLYEYQQKVEEKNLTDKVLFFGMQPREALPDYFHKFDIFIFPSYLKESLGLTAIESLACGVPVIGSNIGGIKTYLKDGYNGYLFEPKNHQDLFEKIIKYFSLTEEAKQEMECNARETALLYEKSKVADNLIKFLSLNAK